jgi:hypothetical protein
VVGDSVDGAVLEAINSDHVVLSAGGEYIVLGLSLVQPVSKEAAKVDHKANYEIARQMPGAVPTGQPSFEDKPLPPAVGNEAFRAALTKAREAPKQ